MAIRCCATTTWVVARRRLSSFAAFLAVWTSFREGGRGVDAAGGISGRTGVDGSIPTVTEATSRANGTREGERGGSKGKGAMRANGRVEWWRWVSITGGGPNQKTKRKRKREAERKGGGSEGGREMGAEITCVQPSYPNRTERGRGRMDGTREEGEGVHAARRERVGCGRADCSLKLEDVQEEQPLHTGGEAADGPLQSPGTSRSPAVLQRPVSKWASWARQCLPASQPLRTALWPDTAVPARPASRLSG